MSIFGQPKLHPFKIEAYFLSRIVIDGLNGIKRPLLKMKPAMKTGIIILSLVGLSNLAIADFMIFPAKRQSNEQLEQDKFSCYGWTRNQAVLFEVH